VDAATLVVAFLLVTMASLAGYLLSQWGFIGNSNVSIIGWLGISIGTLLLLGAAAIVLLTVGLLPELPQMPNIEWLEQRRKSAQSDGTTAERRLDLREGRTDATAATPTDRGVAPAESRSIAGGAAKDRNRFETTASSPQPSGSSREDKSSTALPRVGLVFMEADPWAATKCVYAINLDPGLSRWKIENECGTPVGVVLASCSKGPRECGLASTSWEYRRDGMILPGKIQRPVTDKEETQYGTQIRYVACVLATPVTIELIGQSGESRSSPSWSGNFAAARVDDECLRRVEEWSDAGRRTGQSIDVLLGANAPGNVRTVVISELDW